MVQQVITYEIICNDIYLYALNAFLILEHTKPYILKVKQEIAFST